MSGFMDRWVAKDAGWGSPTIDHKQPLWEGWRFVRVMSGNVEVARVWCDEDDGEQAAAVALVSAAPELLSLVRGIAETIREILDGESYPNGAGWQCILDGCDEAIAKAEGRDGQAD